MSVCHEPWEEERARLLGIGTSCTCGATVSFRCLEPERLPEGWIDELIERLRGKGAPFRQILLTRNPSDE